MLEESDSAQVALASAKHALADARELVSRLERGPASVEPMLHFASCLEISRALQRSAQMAVAMTLACALESGCPPGLIDIPDAGPAG